MLKNKRAGEGIAIMRRFAQASITMNCQIVSCPGINDGPAARSSPAPVSTTAPLWTAPCLIWRTWPRR